MPPLFCDEHRPAGWCWAPDAALLDLPGMDPNTALTFWSNASWPPCCPRSTFGRVRPYVTQAQRILEALPTNALGRWPGKVRVIHRGPPPRLPEISEAILDAVTRGLLDGRRLEVAYRSREKGDRIRCELNPLGLVLKGGLAYLVCTFWEYTDIRQVVLHRVHRAEVLDVSAIVPEAFDLDRYIQEGEFSYPVGEPIGLEAVFRHGAHRHLHDTPLSADQVIEVLAPADLREEFRTRAAAMATVYQPHPPSIRTRPGRRRSKKPISGIIVPLVGGELLLRDAAQRRPVRHGS